MAVKENTTGQFSLDQAGMMSPDEYARFQLDQREQDLLRARTAVPSVVDQVSQSRWTPRETPNQAPSFPMGRFNLHERGDIGGGLTGPQAMPAQSTTGPVGPTPPSPQTGTPIGAPALPNINGPISPRTPQPVSVPPGETVAPISQGTTYQEGQFYKDPNRPDVYWFHNGKLEPIANANTFTNVLGGDWNKINQVPIDQAQLGQYTEGAFYKTPNDPTVYQYRGGQLVAMKDAQDFVAHGGDWNKIIVQPEIKHEMTNLYTPTEQAFDKAQETIAAGLPLINQRYQRIMDEINKAQETGMSAVERQQKALTGRITASMAAKGISGGTMEQGAQAQVGEAFGRGTTDLLSSMSALRSQTAEEALSKEQNIRELLAQSELSEVDKVLAERLGNEQWDLEKRIGNENILSSIQDRVINDFKMKMQELLIRLGQYSGVS